MEIVTDNNIKVVDSYKVRTTKAIRADIQRLSDLYPMHIIFRERSNASLKREWQAHNLLYYLHLFRSHTKDVDLDYPQKWYISVVYFILSLFYWI